MMHVLARWYIIDGGTGWLQVIDTTLLKLWLLRRHRHHHR